MTRFTRTEVGLAPAKAGPGDLDPHKVVGLALHWPAMGKTRMTTPEQVMAGLRAWQDYHVNTKGWSDIAYQEAVDQAGNTYRLRGFGQGAAGEMSGANGDREVNELYGAVLLVLGEGEHPTPAMLTATQRRIRHFRRLYPHGLRIRGHQEVRPEPTACPGPIVMGLIKAGTFNPNHLKETRQ